MRQKINKVIEIAGEGWGEATRARDLSEVGNQGQASKAGREKRERVVTKERKKGHRERVTVKRV